jgi:hypothetical protein
MAPQSCAKTKPEVRLIPIFLVCNQRAIAVAPIHHRPCGDHSVSPSDDARGPGNTLIEPEDGVGECRGDSECRERLGGMLRYYYRAAA